MTIQGKLQYEAEVHGGGGLDLVKLARESASRRPKPCAFLKNASGISPVRRSLFALVVRKQTAIEIRFPLRNPPVRTVILAIAQGFSTRLVCRRSSSPPPSTNMVLTPQIESVPRYACACCCTLSRVSTTVRFGVHLQYQYSVQLRVRYDGLALYVSKDLSSF